MRIPPETPYGTRLASRRPSKVSKSSTAGLHPHNADRERGQELTDCYLVRHFHDSVREHLGLLLVVRHKDSRAFSFLEELSNIFQQSNG